MANKQQDQGGRQQRQPQQGQGKQSTQQGEGRKQMQADKGGKGRMPKAKIGNGQGGKLGGAM